MNEICFKKLKDERDEEYLVIYEQGNLLRPLFCLDRFSKDDFIKKIIKNQKG